MLELIRIPQGRVFIKQTAADVSEGLLLLDPGQEISGHNKPIFEELEELIAGAKAYRVHLKPGDKYTIPWNKTHSHANPGTTASVLKWKFRGDATDIVNLIRINYGN